ncbi:hypothetical protein [Thiohalocapsa halophila]|uniref:hypothetical protein n=1 Tax=Thiohalocapsa halophila TaxID=69359 RepID=UPI001F5B172A|nr:hypothetical protein [Thiohalocapsa halophila]
MDGEEQQRPVTLLHLGLALLFTVGTWVLLRRLPALLEIILLQRYALSAADRYAVTTLTSCRIPSLASCWWWVSPTAAMWNRRRRS